MPGSCLGSNLTFGAPCIESNVFGLCNFICGKGSSVFYFYANFPKQNCLHVALPSQKAGFLPVSVRRRCALAHPARAGGLCDLGLRILLVRCISIPCGNS